MATYEYALRTEALSKSFKQVRAVHNLSLSIKRGEVVALLGPNGAGKTTTIDMILGLGSPDAGSIEVCGMTPRRAIEHGKVSAMMQTGGLLPNITVRETVKLIASFYPNALSPQEALERAGATNFADRMVKKCSGGQQQKLRFAMALINNPELIILDEPTAGVDVEARRDFWAAMRADASQGRTIILATHYLEEADDFADRIVMMNRGEIVADGTPRELRAAGSGRTLCATLTAQPSDVEDALHAFPLTSLDMRANDFTLVAEDTDEIAASLISRGLARDLTIATRSLDDAFVAFAQQEN